MKSLVAILFLSGVLSAPFSNVLNKPAAPRCDSGASHFHLQKSLLYSYEGETITGLVGTSEVRSGLKLRAKCQITPVVPCVYMLQIVEAELLEGQGKNQGALDFKLSSGSGDLSRELKAQNLYFESHEGMVTNIRALSEPVHVLNIKRGILSSLQLKLVSEDNTLTEVDVNGECSTDYQIKARHDSGRIKTVYKKKDLNLCKDRSETNLGIPVTQYPTEKPFSLLKSSSLCKYVMSPRQRIGKVTCEETHLFRPFSSGYNTTSGAMTTVRQNVTLIGHGAKNDQSINLAKIEAREKFSLKYEQAKDHETTTKNYKEASGILVRLGAEDGAKPDTARLFTKLIFAVRRLNMKALTIIWTQHYDCLQRGKCTKEQSERYKKYIVDALSQCGTLQCAEFMTTAITEKRVGTPQSVQFLTGIALVGKPSEDMVGNILYFCQDTPSRTAFLTLGTLIHKYCSQHSCDNLNSRSVIYQADNFLQLKLRHNCQTSTTEELEPITLALKAIGNAGRPYTSVENILKCAVQPGPSFINVDAIQALRRMPCGDKMTQGLLQIFDNLAMDTEIRIETFLALMRCPSQNVIQKVADILEAEKNNQVGSFVWSYLTNALESTEPVHGIPLRDAISQGLQGRNLRTFKLDPLRFSRAYEASYYNRKYEVGGSSQAQIVFHPDSYFPRSAKFNFTVDVLGASVNLLETAARFEGFETLVEQMFGPEGYFPDDRLMQLLNIKPTEAMARGRRSATENEMNEIKNNLELLQDKMKIERKNPTGALSLKVFGHELQFLSFEDIDWLQGEADSINVIDTLINIARGGKVTYTKSFMLLEADHEIPTALGLPLKLAVNGSGVSSVTLKGKFDIRNMFWGKKKFDVRGFVTPSATIDISGKMSVDATHAASGVHVNASLYTSTEINGNATYKEGEGIKLSVEPPTKPVYIVNVKSNLATFLNEKREKILGSPRRFEHKNCANFTRFLGVSLCGHVSLPMAYRDYNAPYFPLTGDSSFGMVFHTTKPELARFEMETRTLTSKDQNRHDWIFNFHVPGITFGRKVVGNSTFQFLDDGKYLSVSCGIHDYKFGKFEAKYNNLTNRLHTKLATPRMSYLQPITIETELFNTRNNNTNAQDIGIAVNASYNNFTITNILSLHKNKDQYGVKSKFTYWPKKHITTEAQFSLQKKSMYMKMADSSSANRFFFAGKLGNSTNRFYAKIGNDLMKKEIKMNGEFNMKNKKILVDIITKPSWNIIKFEAYPRWNALENGFYMRLSHLNSSSYVTGYLGSSNLKRESTLKFNGIFMKKPFLLRGSHYVLSTGRRVEWAAQGFDNRANASVEYSAKRWSKYNVEVSAALNEKTMKSGVFLKEKGVGAYFNDKTIELDADYKNEDKRKGLSILAQMYDKQHNRKKVMLSGEYVRSDEDTTLTLNLDGSGYNNSIAWSYYYNGDESGVKMEAVQRDGSMKRIMFKTGVFRYENEMGLRVFADVLEKDFEAKWSILSGDRSGVKFVARYMKKELTVQSALMANNYLCSEIIGLSADRLETCLQFINNDGEKSLRLTFEGTGKSADMKVGWINSAESKGAVLQMSYNREQISYFFVGLATPPSYTGLRLRGIVMGKSAEALLKYNNTASKRSLDLDLAVQGKLVTFESMLLRDPALQGVQINIIYQKKNVGSLFAHLREKFSFHKKVFRIGGKIMDYGAEYKFYGSKSKLEKKLGSMIIFSNGSVHYKYGYSVSHSNLGTNGQFNHVITTRLHYAKDKVLTSIYQWENSKENFNLLSKMELVPGQYLTNKIAYDKQDRKLSIKYEVLPGLGVTYLAAFINDNQLMGVQSNLTIMDYPMSSSVMLNKLSGHLACKLSYSPVRPPIELESHLRRENGLDFGFTLSAFDQVWNNTVIMDHSSKLLQLNFDVLPGIPIEIFGKVFENKQFVLNMTTCLAFSAELAGTALSKEDYTLVLKHKFMETIFEDLQISISSLQHLNKLRLRWESKAGRELLNNWNTTVQNLRNKSLVRLEALRELASKIANETVNYLRNDGREMLFGTVNKGKEKIIFLKELASNIKINDTVKKYSICAAELVNKLKKDLFELVDEMITYGAPLVDTYRYMEQTVTEMSSEISPFTKLFIADVKRWLSRSATRYLDISIRGKTIKEIVNMITEKTRYYYAMVKENIQNKVQLSMVKCHKIISVAAKMENLTKTAIMAVERFTCNFSMECTKRNVETELKKLVDRVSQYEFKETLERLNETMKRLTLKCKEMVNYVFVTIKEKQLCERAMKVLQPVIKIINDVTRILKMKVIPLREKVEDMVKKSDMMLYLNKLKKQYNELLKAVEKAKVYTTENVQVAKANILSKINETKDYLITVKAESLVMYKKLSKRIREILKMSPADLQVYTKNEIEVNLEKLKEKLIALRRTVTEKVKLYLERYAQVMTKLGNTIDATYKDLMNKRVTIQDVQERLEMFLKKLKHYLEEQKLRAMNKIKALELDEIATKKYQSAVQLYQKTRENLKEKVTTLYPTVIKELRNLLLKIKEATVRYVELAKMKVVEIRDNQMANLKNATNEMLNTSKILVKKVLEQLDKYKEYSIDFVKNLDVKIMKMKERYEGELKRMITEYKTKLINTVENLKMEINNTVKLYQDMPIEGIYLQLQMKARETLDKVLGFVIGETLITYKNVLEKVQEMTEFYQRSSKMVETKLKEITDIVDELNTKYRALLVNNCKKASVYYRTTIQPIALEYFITLNDLGRNAMLVSSVKFEQLKLWYDHVKYIKFKDFYNNVRDRLYNFNLKECCEKKIKFLVEEIKKVRTKIHDLINEVRKESRNVIHRIEQVNKDVKQDAIETFRPYEKIVSNVLMQHKTKALKKLSPLTKKYEAMITLLAEYKNTTERYVKRRLQEIKDLDRDEIMDMLIKSVERYPFLMKVRESYEFIREGHLLKQIVESLNRFPFLYEVRTHKVWSVLKQEILDHEFIVGSHELAKSSMKKLEEIGTDYYSYYLPKVRELREKTHAGLEKLSNDLLTKNDKIKKTILEKRDEIHLKLRNTHEKLRFEGERLVDKIRDLYESGNKKLYKTIEQIGEVSTYDIETKTRKYLKDLLLPVKNAYTDLSRFVVAELLILDKHHREMQERVSAFRTSFTSLTIDIKNKYEDISTRVSEWGRQAWTISKSEFGKLENLSVKIQEHLEKYGNDSLMLGLRLLKEYVPYKDLMNMTPNQLIERLREIDQKAEELFHTVKKITERYIASSLRMFKELKDNVDPEKVREIKDKAQRLLNHTRDQMYFLATEILETTVFVTKFYGSADTVYAAHPEMAQFVDYQLRRFMNCSRICKVKAVKFYYEARDVVERLFAKANYTYHNKLPQLMKYIKTEFRELDTANLMKLKEMATEYLNVSKDYVGVKYAETLAMMKLLKVKLHEYLMSKRSELTLKVNEAKEQLEKFLKNKVQKKVDELYKKLLAISEDAKELLQARHNDILLYSRKLNEQYRSQMTKCGKFISDLPVLTRNAIGRLPLILDMIKHDLKTLMDDGMGKLREGKLFIQDEVFPRMNQTYMANVNILKKHMTQFKETIIDVVNAVKKGINEELPMIMGEILNITEIIREAEIALASGELELKLPRSDELYRILSDLGALLTKKYAKIHAKFGGLYEDIKENSKEVLERVMKDTKTTLKYMLEDLPKFCESKITELRVLAQPKLASLSESADKALQELKRMRRELKDFCEEKELIFRRKSNEARQMVREYVKMLFERGKSILEDTRKQLSGLGNETRLKIEHLRSKSRQINNDLIKAASDNRKELEMKIKDLLHSIEFKKFISKYIDVEDLENKTIEIKEDILNMSIVHDLVEMGESFYMEGRRLIELAKESSEFALYVIKRAVKYSDVWEIVEELTNPFHWIPPSNSMAMIFGKPHVYTFDGQSYQFVGYKKPSCTYVLAHDFRDNNFTVMSQETALIVNTKSGFIKIHASGKVEATVSKDADGKEVKTTHYELPVEMMQMTVIREGSLIKIKHDTGLDIVCDIRHFLCTFNINKFYHGKLAGLLGTNNNEQYDEFLKPDKTIARSVVEFANAWEVSGDPECKVNGAERKLLQPTCEKAPSSRCKELFMRNSTSSPLAPYFKSLDPQPFYDACIFDTSDCKTNVPASESFCNVTAAYTALLREKGVWAQQLPECVSCGSKDVWQKWTERGSKNVDVVLLIPETLNIQTHADQLPNLLRELETDLGKYKPRYAVVGFGGKTAVHRRPHIVTGGGKIFGGIKDVEKAIANMKFTTEAASVFDAIEYLAQLPFLPGASKVVIMVTDQNRDANSNAPLEKAMKELDMQGVIFNVIGPYFQKKQHRDVLGLWKDQTMLRKDKFHSKRQLIGLPVNDYTRLAESSSGGVFNLKAYSKTHGDWTNLLKQAMKTTIVKQIDEDQTYCRQCVCIPSLTAEPVTICRINRHSRCS